MEILDYLRAKGPKLVILVMLPFLAGAAAFYVLAGQPPRYEGELQVTVPDALASGTSSLGLYVANFRQTLTSAEVVDEIASRTGAQADELRTGLEVRQVGQANRIQLSYVSASRDPVAVVPRVAAQTTMAVLASEDVEYEQRELAVADERHEEARAAVDQFRVETGILFPEDEYSSAAEGLRDLEEQLAAAEASGFNVTAGELRPQVEALRARRDVLGQQLLTYQGLAQDLDSADGVRRSARNELVKVETQLELMRSGDLLGEVETERMSQGQTLLAGVAIAAGVAFLLGLGILAAPDVLGRTPTRSSRTARRESARQERADDDWLGVYVADDELAEPRSRLR